MVTLFPPEAGPETGAMEVIVGTAMPPGSVEDLLRREAPRLTLWPGTFH